MKKYTLLVVLTIIYVFSNAQTKFFEEGFETNGSGTFADRMEDEGWNNIHEDYDNGDGPLSWRFEDGGYSPNPSIPNSRRPIAAHGGEYNALLERSTITTTISKLVTPEVDLSIAIKPELHFWYSNFEDVGFHEKIRVYYRSVDEDTYNWYQLLEILNPTTGWQKAIIQLHDSIKFSNIEFAFEGEIGPGWGACIDDIEIIETGIVPKFLEAITANQDLLNPIPTGSKNNPILRLDLTVKGNDGNLYIDTLKLNALLNSTDIIAPADFKLYFTSNSEFSPSESITANIVLEGNQYILTNVSKNLPFGYSFIWFTIDVDEDPNHLMSGKKVDLSISKNNIIVNGLKYPFTNLSPSGYRVITESIFYDDFENSSNWNLTGKFEISEPLGLGGTYGNPDPDYAISGTKILGTALSGINVIDGDYTNNLSDNAYMASHQNLWCKYYKDINIQFFKWLNIEVSDSAKIQVDINNTNAWQTIWRNQTLEKDDKYVNSAYDISSYADRKDSLNTRLILGPTDNTWTFSGWNIDDYAITGTWVHTDAGMLAWASPGAGCGHIAPEPLIVKIKNYGHDELPAPIPVEFSTDGGTTWTTNNYNSALAQDEVAEFTFTDLIDLTTPGENHIMVRTAYPGDQDNRNNVFDTTLYILPTYSLPYSENFENGDGYWQTGGSDTWELGLPNGTKIDTAYSGTNAWVTNLNGDYPNNDSCWIESPCINMIGIDEPIFEAMIKTHGELTKDGLTLQYSIDEGATWKNTPKEQSFNWNWHEQSIDALGTTGWDSITNDWFMVRQTIPEDVEGINPVKFRLVFASDAQNTNEGFAVDDIRIYEAPTDAGITAIVYPSDTCYLGTEEHIKVAIKNYGIRDFKPSDDLITSLKLEGEFKFTETLNVTSNIAPNDTVQLTFTNALNMRDSGAYNYTVYTDIPGDSSQYNAGVVNDTLHTTIRVNGNPYYDLGPDIGAKDPNTVNIDGGTDVGGINYAGYEWSTTATTKEITNVGAGKFHVTVTNKHGCEATDSVEVFPSSTDIGVIAVMGLDTSCIDAFAPNLQIKVKNFSVDTNYHTNDTIQVGYIINETDTVIETITIVNETEFESTDTITYTFTTQPNFSEAGTKNFKCFTVFTPEINYNNDTTERTIAIWPYPNIDLGEDSIYTNMASSILLNAGDGLTNYLWQDASTKDTLRVTSKESYKYYVHANDTNSCGFTASDTTWIITDDWKLDTILTPASACVHSSTEAIGLKLLNNSENTYAIGYKIPVELSLNDSTFKDTISLTEAATPNNYYTYSLTSTVNLVEVGSYNLSAKLVPINDIDTTNNSYEKTIETYPTYYVELGVDSIISKQADSITLDASDKFAVYSWNIGWNQSTYSITDKESKLYKVTATDEHNCATSSDSVQILASDVSITEIKTPRSACQLENTTQISFVVKNEGNDIILAGTAMKVYYKLDNGSWTEKAFTLPYDLNPEKTKIITVNESLTFESNQTYDFTLALSYSEDFYPENDTLNTTIFEFNKPTINLGPDIFTLKPDSIVLKAQEGYANYQWQDFSKGTSFNVSDSASATYHCLVNNAYGCIGADTVNIYSYDLSINSIDNLNNCSTSGNIVTTNIMMNSYDTLLVNNMLTASYWLGSDTITETVTLTDSLYKGKPHPYTFTTPFNVADTGNYSITCSVNMANEVDSTNNSTDTTFRIGAYPVELGEDIITYESSVVFDAGTGYSAYLWNDSTKNQTLTVNSDGKYKVTTTDINGCKASDSVNVLFLVPAYNITEILGLNDACAHSTSETFSFVFVNDGNDTLKASSIIDIAFKVDTMASIQETYTFASNFIPGAVDTIAFTAGANLSATAEHTVLVSATVNAKSSTNDTVINTWPAPIIDLGPDIETTLDSDTLNAGIGFTSYLWNTEAETQKIIVSNNGEYSVTVTDANGCINSDTIKVFFVPASLYISDFTNPLKGCGAFNNETVRMVVTNGGQKIIPAGTKLVLGYQLNNGERIDESNELQTNFHTSAVFPYEFSTPLNSDETGNQTLNLYVQIDGVDMDTSTQTIPVYAKPIFFGGNDTIRVSSYPYELDSDVDAESYLWNTSETTKAISINNAGDFSVQITTSDECQFDGSVTVLTITGIHDEWSKLLKVYPNPGDNEIWVELPDDIKDVALQVTNLNGKVILNNEHISNDVKLDISEWKQGMYILRIFNDTKYGIYQIIKK